LGLPTLVVQEGGYRNRVLGATARIFFKGLTDGLFGEGENSGMVPTGTYNGPVIPS
jgi:hypothetical protein